MRLPPDFETAWTLSFLGARAIPGLELVDNLRYGRVVTLGDSLHWFEGRFAEADLTHGTTPAAPRSGSRQMARWLFDLDADLEPFREMARRDRILAPLVRRRPGLRRPLLLDPFEATVRAIIGQLVSVAAASTLLTRLVQTFGTVLTSRRGPALAFPSAADLEAAGHRRLARLGLPRGKANALVAVAERCRRGDLDWADLRGDAALADRVLRRIPGIGPWTSGYVRWRGLGDPDAFLDADLGIIKALEARRLARRDIGRRTDRWRPWRGFAIAHLWAALAE